MSADHEPIAMPAEPLPELIVDYEAEADVLYLAARMPVGMFGDEVAEGFTVFYDAADDAPLGGYGDGVNAVMVMSASKVLGPYLDEMVRRRNARA